jgi:hypothetical protein
MASAGSDTEAFGEDAPPESPLPSASHATAASHYFASRQDCEQKLVKDITDYFQQVVQYAAASVTLHGIMHMICFDELEQSSDKIECLLSMMDPVTLWDPHGCLAHTPTGV